MRLGALALVVLEAGCPSDRTWLAELVAAQQVVEEERAQTPTHWAPARLKSRYHAGDAIRTGPASSARVRLVTGEEVALEASSVLRFGERPREVALELGLAEVVAGDADVRVTTSFGAAVIEAGGRARIGRKDDGWEVAVSLGQAVIDGEGEDQRVTAGKNLKLSIGGAVMEPEPPPPDAGPPPDAAPPAAGDGIGVRVTGGVTQQAAGQKDFAPLAAGDGQLAPGTRVRLEAGAKLELTRGEDRLAVHGPASAVVAPRGELLASIDSGRISFDGSGRLAFELPGATLQRAGGAAAHGEAAAGRRESRLRVAGGTMAVKGRGRAVRVGPAETASLYRDGRVAVWKKGLERAELVINLGESPVIHDPSPPTAIGVGFEAVCPTGGVLNVTSPRASFMTEGHEAANVLLPKGIHRYQVRCLEEGVPGDRVVSHGTIRVLRDAGTAALPKRPQRAVVDADGRRWSLVYQTILPEITFRWPAGKGNGRVELHLVDSGKPPRVVAADGAVVTIASGQLAEGSYQWWFAGAAGRASPRTELRILYDSSAQSASIRRPAVGEGWSAMLAVAGIVDAGWHVAVGSSDVALDGHNRFAADVPAPLDGVLAIRLLHPKKGTQIYLRRDPKRAAERPR